MTSNDANSMRDEFERSRIGRADERRRGLAIGCSAAGYRHGQMLSFIASRRASITSIFSKTRRRLVDELP